MKTYEIMNEQSMLMSEKLRNGFLQIANEKAVDYFSNWTFDEPLVISTETNRRLHRIRHLLYKCVCHFSENYQKYRDLMPLSEKADKIVKMCSVLPYRSGTYRTDFMIDINNQIKLIEITCRFALNGIFISGFFNLLADRYLRNKPEVKTVDNYAGIFDYLIDLWGDFEHICILKGHFDNNESKYAVPIFEHAGFRVHVLRPEDIADNLSLLNNAVVISELNQEQWFELPDDVISALLQSKLMNDPRTIFLIHDKRFFSVLHEERFMNNALTENEKKEFEPYITPTYRPGEFLDMWSDARYNKDKWVLKPFDQGRSINIFAGCVTEDEDWENIFLQNKDKGMVLQPYINQRKFPNTLKGVPYEDYAVGLLLFFNDQFFGPGVIRTSSFPVTNMKDDRKMIAIVTDDIKNSNLII